MRDKEPLVWPDVQAQKAPCRQTLTESSCLTENTGSWQQAWSRTFCLFLRNPENDQACWLPCFSLASWDFCMFVQMGALWTSHRLGGEAPFQTLPVSKGLTRLFTVSNCRLVGGRTWFLVRWFKNSSSISITFLVEFVNFLFWNKYVVAFKE